MISLSYDNNGNLTDDGVLRYAYDAWNRLRKSQRSADRDTTTIAAYSYLADGRRASKVVTSCGVEATPNDGGNTTIHYYYGSGAPSLQGWGTDVAAGLRAGRWSIFEERNGSDQSLRQYVWGTQYIDEPVFMDANGAPANSNDCDPDNTPQGETGQDRRYFYHQDRNWNVVALTEYADGAGTNGRIAERYHYTPYGEFLILKGNTGSGELASVLPTSPAGNVFMHQGLPWEHDKRSYHNRRRDYAPLIDRFTQRDPVARRPRPGAGYQEGMNLYQAVASNPMGQRDPSGLGCRIWFHDCHESGSTQVGKCTRDCEWTCSDTQRATVATASCGTMTCEDLVQAGYLPAPGVVKKAIKERKTNWLCKCFGIGGPPDCGSPSGGLQGVFCEGPLGAVDWNCDADECRAKCDYITGWAGKGCDLLPPGTPKWVEAICKLVELCGPQACGDLCNTLCN